MKDIVETRGSKVNKLIKSGFKYGKHFIKFNNKNALKEPIISDYRSKHADLNIKRG